MIKCQSQVIRFHNSVHQMKPARRSSEDTNDETDESFLRVDRGQNLRLAMSKENGVEVMTSRSSEKSESISFIYALVSSLAAHRKAGSEDAQSILEEHMSRVWECNCTLHEHQDEDASSSTVALLGRRSNFLELKSSLGSFAPFASGFTSLTQVGGHTFEPGVDTMDTDFCHTSTVSSRPTTRHFTKFPRFHYAFQQDSPPLEHVSTGMLNRTIVSNALLKSIGNASSDGTSHDRMQRGCSRIPVPAAGSNQISSNYQTDAAYHSWSQVFTPPTTTSTTSCTSPTSPGSEASYFGSSSSRVPCPDVTVVGYYFCDEPIPYRTTIHCRQPTLAHFKQVVTKKGNLRYFFKKATEEFDGGIVNQEITDDDAILPLWEGKVVGKVERIQ